LYPGTCMVVKLWYGIPTARHCTVFTAYKTAFK